MRAVRVTESDYLRWVRRSTAGVGRRRCDLYAVVGATREPPADLAAQSAKRADKRVTPEAEAQPRRLTPGKRCLPIFGLKIRAVAACNAVRGSAPEKNPQPSRSDQATRQRTAPTPGQRSCATPQGLRTGSCSA